MVANKLSPGIRTSFWRTENDEVQIPVYPDRADEVKGYMDNRILRQLPFVNQQRTLEEALGVLRTRYPFLAMVGGPGCGKTSMIDWMGLHIVGEIPDEDVERDFGHVTLTEMKKTRERASACQHRDYINLPNLFSNECVALDYTDPEACEQDELVAESFCRDVDLVFGNYGQDFRTDIKAALPEEHFREYVRAQIGQMYVDIYEEVIETLQDVRDRYSKNRLDIMMAVANPVADLADPSLTGSFRLIKTGRQRSIHGGYKNYAGYQNDAKPSHEEVETGLGKYWLNKHAKEAVANFLWDLDFVTVDGLEEEDILKIVRDEWNAYNRSTVRPLVRRYEKGELTDIKQALPVFRETVSMPAQPMQISDGSVDSVVEKFERIRARYDEVKCSDGLKAWMDDVVRYGRLERPNIERSLRKMFFSLKEQEKKDKPEVRLTKRKNGRNEIEDAVEEALSRREEQARIDGKQDYTLKIYHDGEHVPINEVFVVNAHRDHSTSGGVTLERVREFSQEGMFCKFEERWKPIDGDEQKKRFIPPHMRVRPSGSFFRGGVIVIPDKLDEFIQAIAGTEIVASGNASPQGELFLDYLQSGWLTVVSKGISYKFHAPRIIMGSSNEDPFSNVRHGTQIKEEVGIGDRFTTIHFRSVEENTAEHRQGVLEVILRAVDDFNDQNTDRTLSISEDALALSLSVIENDETLAGTFYRHLSKGLERILAHATMKAGNGGNGAQTELEITADSIRKYLADVATPTRFAPTDGMLNEFDQYLDRDEKNTGFVHGLSVFVGRDSVEPASPVRVSSYLVPRTEVLKAQESHFEMEDVNAGLVGANPMDPGKGSTMKGFTLAQDFIWQLLYQDLEQIPDNPSPFIGWQVKTQYENDWGGGDGPSASMAIAFSMLSALSGQDEDMIYRNRFVTGTINPNGGRAGKIGGVMQKGMIPNRVYQKLQEAGVDEEVYFMFPASNLRHLTQIEQFDPYRMGDHIGCLPYVNFAQGWHLMTCDHAITEDQWQESYYKGPETLKATLQRVRNKIPLNFSGIQSESQTA